jgi:hypothetical protein
MWPSITRGKLRSSRGEGPPPRQWFLMCHAALCFSILPSSVLLYLLASPDVLNNTGELGLLLQLFEKTRSQMHAQFF